MDKRTKNLENSIIGEWTVLSYAGIIKNNAHWHCRCSCGFEKPVKAQYLIGGNSRKCMKCAVTKRKIIEETIPDFYWRVILRNASKRSIPVTITKDFAYNLLVKQNYICNISGLPIYMAKCGAEYLEGKTTASLDRIDSSKFYEEDNVQWLHKDINMMKHVFTKEYFLSLCAAVVSHHDDQRFRGRVLPYT